MPLTTAVTAVSPSLTSRWDVIILTLFVAVVGLESRGRPFFPWEQMWPCLKKSTRQNLSGRSLKREECVDSVKTDPPEVHYACLPVEGSDVRVRGEGGEIAVNHFIHFHRVGNLWFTLTAPTFPGRISNPRPQESRRTIPVIWCRHVKIISKLVMEFFWYFGFLYMCSHYLLHPMCRRLNTWYWNKEYTVYKLFVYSTNHNYFLSSILLQITQLIPLFNYLISDPMCVMIGQHIITHLLNWLS